MGRSTIKDVRTLRALAYAPASTPATAAAAAPLDPKSKAATAQRSSRVAAQASGERVQVAQRGDHPLDLLG